MSKPAGCSSQHVFTVAAADPDVMHFQEDITAPKVAHKLVRKKHVGKKWAAKEMGGEDG